MSRFEIVERAERHALAVLEFPRVLERIAAYASSEPGRAHVLALYPWRDAAAVEEGLAIADEMVGLLLRLERWSPPPIPAAEGTLKRTGVEGAALDAEQLASVLVLLRSSRLVRSDLRRFAEELPALAELGDRMIRLPDVEARLDRSLDPNGGLSDQASPDLGRLRKSLRGSRSALVRRLERFVRQLPERLQVPDGSVTLRAGRYCVPVRREGMSQVGGIVHDESATHRTVFVEPPEAIEAMNRIAELERAESREIQRVLRELTEVLRPEVDGLQLSLAALAESDSLYARARYALSHGGQRPRVAERAAEAEAAYEAVDAFHPLLESTGEPVVPFHLQLQPDERVLLISGPNAGGKTVLLKAIGLLSVMSQSGILPPVGEGTVFPLFRSFHAIIGDEQSIQASLSTFSAQVEGLKYILEAADGDSLVLVDELGGNTDPAEGGALAAALLLRLARQGGLSVVTTHLGELKDLAAQESSIVNASLQFDTDAMQPTFRLMRDRPGRSYALEIAGRLGLPDDVLDVARSRLSGGERRMEALLRELEEREAEVRRLEVEARSGVQQARDTRAQLESAAERLGRREREIERDARKRVERYLLDARRSVEEEIERLREAAARALPSAGTADTGAFDEAARQARAGAESLLGASRAEEAALPSPDPPPAGALVVGEGARSRSLGVEGEVLEVRDGEAVLEAGGMRFTLPLVDLEASGRPPATRVRNPSPALPEIAPATEIDLRGLRVDEVAAAVSQGLDAAIVNDVPSLRIIHGKGTGALRLEVARVLDADGRVHAHRPGGFQEGGSGVTVVEFGTMVG